MHVDGKRCGDRARHELPFDAVDAAGASAGSDASQLLPGVGGHVQMVLVAAGLVRDLFTRLADYHASPA